MTQLERFAEQHQLVPEHLRRWLIEAMVLGASADGAVDRREAEEIALLAATKLDFEDLESGEFQRYLSDAFEGLRRDGFVPRVHALAGALPRYVHRVLAFRVATKMAFANGRVSAEEIGLLQEMQSVFGIVESDVARAIEDAQTQGTSLPDEVEPVEAYLDCLLMAASASGGMSDLSFATIIAFIMERDEFEALSGDMLRDYIRRNMEMFATPEARRARLRTIADAMPFAEHRETAWGLVFSLVAASGTMSEAEHAFLEAMDDAFDMERTRRALAGDFEFEELE